MLRAAGAVGLVAFERPAPLSAASVTSPVPRVAGAVCLGLFLALLVGLPAARGVTDDAWLDRFESFYRVGSLVFGGGHVVLPLLEAEAVGSGWVTRDEFLAGYGAVQAVPGPLFSFAAYLGAAMRGTTSGLAGVNAAVVGLVLAALYDPMWAAVVRGPHDFALVLGAVGALVFLQWPPWLVVAAAGAVGGVLGRGVG